ncbi:MAG: HAMP domain-containing sensor histidine kinase [Caulobacter sp.]
MRPRELWRASPFRLTLLNGAVFAVAVMALLGLIYWRTAGYITRQLDAIIVSESAVLANGPADTLPERVRAAVAADRRAIAYYGLFSADGVWITGNVRRLPANAEADNRPRTLNEPGLQPGARGLVRRLPWGEQLFVVHDAKVLTGLRDIIVNALMVSGALILLLGLSAAALLSIPALRRVEQLRVASRAALAGRLGVRLPVSHRRDEIDMLANLANGMMDETERLLWEVKSVGDNVAHDLRTPLNRLRAALYRATQDSCPDEEARRDLIERALEETDELLVRFRALTRIGEIERRDRQAGFEAVRLRDVLEQVFELHDPAAEELGVAIVTDFAAEAGSVFADPALLFEAVSNLVDNALKFTPRGGRVTLRLLARDEGPRIEVVDNGPGVPEGEREAVLNRFYRSQRTLDQPGSGLGLSIVAAIARMHHFTLSLEDAEPGLRIALDCWPRGLEA